MSLIFIFSSNSFGGIGFYNVLFFFNFNEFQYLKFITIGNIIICGKNTFNCFYYKYLLCRFFFIINYYNIYNIKFSSFVNFYINFILYIYLYYNFFNYFLNLNNLFFFGGAYIYNLYFFLIDKLFLSLCYKNFYGNIFFPVYFVNFWYIIFFNRSSKYFIFIIKKKENCFFFH